MRTSNNLTWVAIAALASGIATGCQRQSDSVDRKMDQTSEQQAQKGGDTAKDAAITTKVKAALTAQPGLKSMRIDVNTVNGIVTLTGAVDSQETMERVQQIAQGVEGVRSVENRLN